MQILFDDPPTGNDHFVLEGEQEKEGRWHRMRSMSSFEAHAQPSKDLSVRVTATSPGCMACYWKPVRCSLEASALQCSMLSRDQTSMHSLDDNLVIWEPLAHFAKKHKVQSKLIANCFSLSTAAVVGWLRQWPLPFRKHCTSLTAMLPNGHPMPTIICVSRKQF